MENSSRPINSAFRCGTPGLSGVRAWSIKCGPMAALLRSLTCICGDCNLDLRNWGWQFPTTKQCGEPLCGSWHTMHRCYRPASMNWESVRSSRPATLPACTPAGTTPADQQRQARTMSYTYPLDLHRWSDAHRRGLRLRVSPIEQVNTSGWPATLKTRSRVHFWLAEREAKLHDPAALPLLLSADGCVAEGSTGSVLAFEKQRNRFIAPPADRILNGVSLQHTLHLIESSAFAHSPENPDIERRDLELDELCAADEVFWTSTSCGILPVTRIDDAIIGDGNRGPIFQILQSAWAQSVGSSMFT